MKMRDGFEVVRVIVIHEQQDATIMNWKSIGQFVEGEIERKSESEVHNQRVDFTKRKNED